MTDPEPGSVRRSPWPDAVVRAALLDPDDAARAWATARCSLGLGGLAERNADWLLGLVYRNLREAKIDDRDLPRLKGIYRRTWYVNQVGRKQLADDVAALHARGVRVVLLGAPTLALRYYRDLGLRPMRPLEIRVHESDLTSTLHLMEARGWRIDAGGRRPRFPRVFRRFRLAHHAAGALILHHASGAPGGRGSLAAWQLDGTPVEVLAPADQLLEIVASGARAIPAPAPHAMADAVMLLRHEREPMDWRRFIGLATRRRLVAPARTLLGGVGPLLSPSVPEAVLRELGRLDHVWRAPLEAGLRALRCLACRPRDPVARRGPSV